MTELTSTERHQRAIEAMTERATLQRRIKNQRKALRAQHKALCLQAALIRSLVLQKQAERNNGYRHAAMIAERHLFGGWIARAIRVWL